MEKVSRALTRASTDNNWPRVPRFGDYFQLAIASMSFPFCCCLFSLYVKKKEVKETTATAQHTTAAGERKIECWEMKLWKIFKTFYYVFVVSCTQFSQAPQCTQISSFPTFLAFLFRVQFILKWKGIGRFIFQVLLQMSILHGGDGVKETLYSVREKFEIFCNHRRWWQVIIEIY